MNKEEQNINVVKNIILIFVFLCSIIFAFINPFKSLAFTAITALILLLNFNMEK